MGQLKNTWALSRALLFLTAFALPAAAHAQALLAKTRAEKSSDVSLELTELKRSSGNTVTMKALITNNTAKTFSISWSSVYLLNTEGRMKHGVVKDERNRYVASGTSVKAGQSVEVWAKFVAPPENVKKMTTVIGGFAPMEDIPLGF